MLPIPLSTQLYTVRDLTAADFPGTVKKIAALGYTAVELAGYGNLKTSAEVKKACDDANLKISGVHIPLDAFETHFDQSLADAQTLGVKTLIIPWLPESRRGPDRAGWLNIAHTLNSIAAKLKPHGYTLLYHNHAFEFTPPVDGRPALDLLWEQTDPELVKSELDVYWAAHAGHDPAAYIAKLGPRCRALHLKDLAPGPDKKFAPVGSGTLDFPAILAAAKAAHIGNFVVEQDDCYGQNPLDSLRASYAYLQSL